MAGWDGEKFGQFIVAEVNASIERAVTPLLARLDALESSVETRPSEIERKLEADMKRFDESLKRAVDKFEVKTMIDEVRADIETTLGPEMQIALSKMVEEAVAGIPTAKDGKDVDMDAVRTMIVEECKDIRAGLESTIGPEMQEALSKMVEEIPTPRDGKDAEPIDMDAVQAHVDGVLKAGLDEYRKSVEALPVPRDGKDAEPVDMDAVRSMVDEAVSALPPAINGRDGADVTEALISGTDLHLVLSNGQTKNVGRVVGWDGVDVDIDGVNKRVNDMVSAIPAPKDGMGFDDLTMEHDGERTFKFVLSRGDQRKEFEFAVPVVLDRGVYTEGKTYAKGDSVTFGGSVHIAQTDGVTCKPGTSGDWRLAVKRGRDGRDGVMTVPKPHEPVKLGGR